MIGKTPQVDEIISMDSALVQHGRGNDRVYLLDPGSEKPDKLCARLIGLAKLHGYSRIMAKVPLSHKMDYLKFGFVEEARIPNLFGSKPGVYLSQFRTKARAINKEATEQEAMVAKVRQKAAQNFKQKELLNGLVIEVLSKKSAPEISSVLSRVFESYPFPVQDPKFIEEEMQAGTVYFGIRKAGELIAVSSAECKEKYMAAECTDFATLPEYRGAGLAQSLLSKMISEFGETYQLYTIARAVEFGMNLVFARAGWEFGGTLVNSTQIGGKIESMNIWFMNEPG